ncbi:Intersectin 1 (SH3 domain protein) [Irineochytrium annulatum]|nr:Intersectin 1 (SH3 domain protein) [Irineochytrium annulatum]
MAATTTPRVSLAAKEAPSPPKEDNSHLKSALAGLRGRLHDSDDEDDEDDWGSSAVLAVPPFQAPRVSVAPVSPPTVSAPSPATPTPQNLNFFQTSPTPPSSFDTTPAPGGPPPPPPPPPPPGVVAPVKKFERGSSATDVDDAPSAPRKKPTAADVGGVGPSLFGVDIGAAVAAGRKGLKSVAPAPPPSKAKEATGVFERPSLSSASAAPSHQPAVRAKPPPPPPSKKAIATVPLSGGGGGDEWEVVDKEDAQPAASAAVSRPEVAASFNPFKPGGVGYAAAVEEKRKSMSQELLALAGGDGADDFSSAYGKAGSRMSVVSDVFSDGRAFEQAFGTPAEGSSPVRKTLKEEPEIPSIFQPVSPPATLYHVRCLYAFTAGRPDDLSLEAGDVLDVEKEDGEWLYGARDGSRGWFPKNFIEIFDPHAPEPVTTEVVVCRAEAIYEYEASRDDEMSIAAGDVVEVLSKEGDWWKVRKGDRSGVVPSNYLKEVAAESASSPPPLPHKPKKQHNDDAFLSAGGIPQKRGGSEFSFVSAPEFHDGASPPPMSRGNSFNGAGSSQGGQHWVTAVSKADFERLTLEERKRQEAIYELISTEQSYVRDLQIIVEVFCRPMTQLLSEQDMQGIFSNIEDLLLTNSLLLSDWEDAQVQSNYVITNIGTLFERHAKPLECYQYYCGNQMAASKLLQTRRQQSERLQEFLKSCQRDPQCRHLDLSSFLLQPMQRITRYNLILKQILHYTPPTHPEHASVVRAMEAADRVAQMVNASAREQESRERIEAIVKEVDLEGGSDYDRVDLYAPTRWGTRRMFLFESPLAKSKSGRKLQGYMFSDMILLAHPEKNMFKDRGYPLTLYRAPMFIDQVSIRDVPRSFLGKEGMDETAFQFVYADEVVTVKAASAAVKAKWMAQHEAALKALSFR